MKKLIIVSGKWTEAGNFSGYDQFDERLHIPTRIMEGLGFKKGDVVEFPLYAAARERTFNVLDDEGNPTEEQFTRLQAGCLFKEQSKLIEALGAPALLDIAVTNYVKSAATSAGMTEAEIEQLAGALV
jgi:hypothetical protein